MQIANQGSAAMALLRGSALEIRAKVRGVWRSISWRTEYLGVYFRARKQRSRLRDVLFVGITGSAGKTTTKDLAAAVLETLGPCSKTAGTENEPIFVARTVLRAGSQHRSCVVELAAFRPGCLDQSLRLLQPDIGVLTLIARDHFSSFKSVEAIAAEKGKVIESLSASGTAVLNIDDPLVRSIGARCKGKVIGIGTGEGATIRLLSARSQWPEPLTLEVEFDGRQYSVRTSLHGRQLALSALAALGVGVAAGIHLKHAISALAAVTPAEGRMQVVESDDGVVFVRDDWKAPHWSLQAAMDYMKDARARRKVLILGTLSDYSLSASKLYPKVARHAMEVADLVVFVGPHAMRALKARRSPDDESLKAFPDIREAAEWLRTALVPGDLVLLKGSNKADHLVRLFLDRGSPVECWRERCSRSYFCTRCSLAYEPMPGPPRPAGVRHPRSTSGTSDSTFTGSPIVVGLGNPDDRFSNTPHNIGHRVVDELARALGGTWAAGPDGLVSTIVVDNTTVKLLKPGASINHSGAPVSRFLEANSASASRCIVLHDDMDLMFGDVRIKRDGGDSGHKGVRSLIAALGTGSVARVRVGVRKDGDQRAARELVLAKFSAADEGPLALAIDRAGERVLELVRMWKAESSRGVVDAGALDPAGDECGERPSTV